MKQNKYTLWFYDVWGNETDGFQVNNRHCIDRFFVVPTMPKTYNRGTDRQFVDFVPSDKEILRALVNGYILKSSALSADIDIDGGGQSIYLTKDNGYPLCELLLNESNY